MSGPAPKLRTVPDIPGITRGLGNRRAASEPTGFAALDRVLLGGWPIGAISQLVSSHEGLGLSVITPVLARLSQQKRRVLLVAPPYVPYASALQDAGIVLEQLMWIAPKDRVDALWAAEQALRSGLFAAVSLWSPLLPAPIERRLQLAAEAGRNLGFLCHAGPCEAHAVAAVRLAIAPAMEGLQLRVERCRGGHAGASIIATALAA